MARKVSIDTLRTNYDAAKTALEAAKADETAACEAETANLTPGARPEPEKRIACLNAKLARHAAERELAAAAAAYGAALDAADGVDFDSLLGEIQASHDEHARIVRQAAECRERIHSHVKARYDAIQELARTRRAAGLPEPARFPSGRTDALNPGQVAEAIVARKNAKPAAHPTDLHERRLREERDSLIVAIESAREAEEAAAERAKMHDADRKRTEDFEAKRRAEKFKSDTERYAAEAAERERLVKQYEARLAG